MTIEELRKLLNAYEATGNAAEYNELESALVENADHLLKVAEAAQNLPRLIDQASASRRDVDYIKVADEIELLRKALEELNNE